MAYWSKMNAIEGFLHFRNKNNKCFVDVVGHLLQSETFLCESNYSSTNSALIAPKKESWKSIRTHAF